MTAETLRNLAAQYEISAGVQDLQAAMADRNAAIPNLHPVAAEHRREVAARFRAIAAQMRTFGEACTAGAAAIAAQTERPS